jgi:hypothetical protein
VGKGTEVAGRRPSGRRPRGFSPVAMLRLRPGDHGQTATEYLGLVVVVVAIIGGLVGTGIGTEIMSRIGTAICEVAGGGNCGDAEAGGGDGLASAGSNDGANGDANDGANGGSSGGTDGSGQQPTNDGSGAKSPEEKAVEQAEQDLKDAERDWENAKRKTKEAAAELMKIASEELGIDAALDCFAKGRLDACGETAVNVALSFAGGVAGKLLKKYGAPWNWKKGYQLAQRIRKHGGDLAGGAKGMWDANKKVKKAGAALEEAKKKLPKREKKPERQPEGKPEKKRPEACHSFLPGTRVLLADGTRTAIEDVRVGERVTVTDPVRGLTTSRPVVGTITTEDDKAFTRLTVRVKGRTSTITTTDTHPFWLADRHRWADAGDIRPGAELRTPSGTTLQVTGVGHHTKQQRTHDLTIAGIHTYYVAAGAQNALVHNNDGRCKELELGPFDSFEQARNEALDRLGEIDPHTRQPLIGRLETATSTYGKKVGFTTRPHGVYKEFRMDYDPKKGPHINVTVGKGASAKKYAVKWKGTEEGFERLLENNT